MEHFKNLKDEELTKLIHTYTINCQKLLQKVMNEMEFNSAREFLRAKKFLDNILGEKSTRQFHDNLTV